MRTYTVLSLCVSMLVCEGVVVCMCFYCNVCVVVFCCLSCCLTVSSVAILMLLFCIPLLIICIVPSCNVTIIHNSEKIQNGFSELLN